MVNFGGFPAKLTRAASLPGGGTYLGTTFPRDSLSCLKFSQRCVSDCQYQRWGLSYSNMKLTTNTNFRRTSIRKTTRKRQDAAHKQQHKQAPEFFICKAMNGLRGGAWECSTGGYDESSMRSKRGDLVVPSLQGSQGHLVRLNASPARPCQSETVVRPLP